MSARVAILGTGPSAAYAYRACLDSGVFPGVYGPRSARPHGAFWLHALPASCANYVPVLTIRLMATGTPEGYAQKIWRSGDVQTSFPREGRTEHGYPPDEGLNALWGGGPATDDRKLTDEDIATLCRQNDLVIKTFPPPLPPRLRGAYSVCRLAWRTKLVKIRYSSVVYNGRPEDRHVRYARIWGEESFEYPAGVASLPPGEGWREQLWMDIPPQEHPWFYKELEEWTEQQPKHPNLLVTGRYATYQRKMLSHETYLLVSAALSERFGRASGSLTWPSPLGTAAPSATVTAGAAATSSD